jgi:kinetochore protein Mis12/MTW1
MQNILCIRPSEPRDWIRLGHYDGLDLEGVRPGREEEDGRPSAESVRRLRRRLQASQQLNAMLHAEKARNEALLEALRGVVGMPKAGGKKVSEEKRAAGEAKMEIDDNGVDLSADAKPPFAFLHDAGGLAAGSLDKPLETTTSFTMSQLQALRALSTSLRNIMPDLQGSSEEDDGGRRTWRRERMEYVETATRKHLEQMGLELGKDGDVRDGEWQGEGRKLAKDEVEGLEKVVALLGATSKGDEMDES